MNIEDSQILRIIFDMNIRYETFRYETFANSKDLFIVNNT